MSRDQLRARTPLRCPICRGRLTNTMIRQLGTVTPTSEWQMHAGECPEHGWFQAETVGRPPREIFAVNRPFGASRRLIVDGQERYQFPTRWTEVDFDTRRDKYDKVDQFDASLWEAQ